MSTLKKKGSSAPTNLKRLHEVIVQQRRAENASKAVGKTVRAVMAPAQKASIPSTPETAKEITEIAEAKNIDEIVIQPVISESTIQNPKPTRRVTKAGEQLAGLISGQIEASNSTYAIVNLAQEPLSVSGTAGAVNDALAQAQVSLSSPENVLVVPVLSDYHFSQLQHTHQTPSR